MQRRALPLLPSHSTWSRNPAQLTGAVPAPARRGRCCSEKPSPSWPSLPVRVLQGTARSSRGSGYVGRPPSRLLSLQQQLSLAVRRASGALHSEPGKAGKWPFNKGHRCQVLSWRRSPARLSLELPTLQETCLSEGPVNTATSGGPDGGTPSDWRCRARQS